jgi:hypothetical protein
MNNAQKSVEQTIDLLCINKKWRNVNDCLQLYIMYQQKNGEISTIVYSYTICINKIERLH